MPHIWSRSRRAATASNRRCAGCAASREVETAAVFGRELRIAGMDRTALRAAIDGLGDGALHWQEVEPRLDDVFIHMLRDTEA